MIKAVEYWVEMRHLHLGGGQPIQPSHTCARCRETFKDIAEKKLLCAFTDEKLRISMDNIDWAAGKK